MQFVFLLTLLTIAFNTIGICLLFLTCTLAARCHHHLRNMKELMQLSNDRDHFIHKALKEPIVNYLIVLF